MLALLIQYGYLILFPFAIIEGPMLAVMSGFLIYSGHFNAFAVLGIFVVADIITDLWYFGLGHNVNRIPRAKRYIQKSKFLNKNLDTMKYLWEKKMFLTMLLGKHAYLISVPIIISAGMIKMSFLRFLSYSIPVSIIQSIIFLSIGYLLGNSYSIISNYIAFPGFIVAIIFIIIIISYHNFTKKIAKKINKNKLDIKLKINI